MQLRNVTTNETLIYNRVGVRAHFVNVFLLDNLHIERQCFRRSSSWTIWNGDGRSQRWAVLSRNTIR